MPDLNPGAQRLMGYFGAVQAAVNERMSTADLWASVRSAAEARGEELSGVSLQGMNQLRSIAVAMRNASDELASATGRLGVVDTGIGIDDRMIAEAPWARSMADQSLNPEYQARFQHTYTTSEGEEVTFWRTVILGPGDVTTVAHLRDIVEAEAEAMAIEYQGAHVGVGGIQLLAV